VERGHFGLEVLFQILKEESNYGKAVLKDLT